MKTEGTALARHKELNVTCRTRAETDLKFSFTFFYCSSSTCFLAESIFTDSCQGRRLLLGAHPKMGRRHYSAVFTSNCVVSNWLSKPRRVRLPTKSFSCFLSRTYCPNGVFMSSLQPIRTGRRFAADTFLFLTRARIIILLLEFSVKSVLLVGKKLKFAHSTKWFIHKLKSVVVNEIHRLLQNYETQKDHLKTKKIVVKYCNIPREKRY